MTEQGEDAAPGEIGVIVGRRPALTPGYYKRPDLTAQAIVDGWLHTGDLGCIDEDGFPFLVDRKKDMIISGGVNVFPKDIEESIVQHPAVRETAMFGVPDEKWGETPVAAVILHKTRVLLRRNCVHGSTSALMPRISVSARWLSCRIFRAAPREKRSSVSSVNPTGPDEMRRYRISLGQSCGFAQP
jgi:acyl-CoA synthetase (AMP-forming)/AMP-acid ligase II